MESRVKVSDLSNELAQLTESLRDVKRAMNEKGNSMTDTTPLVTCKQALTKLKSETKDFDLRIGVLVSVACCPSSKCATYEECFVCLANLHIAVIPRATHLHRHSSKEQTHRNTVQCTTTRATISVPMEITDDKYLSSHSHMISVTKIKLNGLLDHDYHGDHTKDSQQPRYK